MKVWKSLGVLKPKERKKKLRKVCKGVNGCDWNQYCKKKNKFEIEKRKLFEAKEL